MWSARVKLTFTALSSSSLANNGQHQSKSYLITWFTVVHIVYEFTSVKSDLSVHSSSSLPLFLQRFSQLSTNGGRNDFRRLVRCQCFASDFIRISGVIITYRAFPAAPVEAGSWQPPHQGRDYRTFPGWSMSPAPAAMHVVGALGGVLSQGRLSVQSLPPGWARKARKHPGDSPMSAVFHRHQSKR